MQQNSLTLSDETAVYLGGILESVKVFYSVAPVSISTDAASPAKKAAPPKKVAKQTEAAAASLEKPATPAKDTERDTATAAAKTPKVEDDLTAIQGIGPALRRKLNEQGIHSFAQIAALSDEDIDRLEGSIIKFSGRIKRDDWIGQAQRFSKEMR